MGDAAETMAAQDERDEALADVAKVTGKTKAQVEEEFFDSLQPKPKPKPRKRAAKNVEAPPAAEAGEAASTPTGATSDAGADRMVPSPAASTEQSTASATSAVDEGSEPNEAAPPDEPGVPSGTPVPPVKKVKGRIAGDEGSYSFALCRVGYDDEGNRTLSPTEHGFSLPSVTTLIGDVLGKPGNAMAYWGFKMAAGAAIELAREVEIAELDYDQFHTLAKGIGKTPTRQRDSADDRGSKAHDIMESLARGHYTIVDDYALIDKATGEAVELDEYAKGGLKWWVEANRDEWTGGIPEIPVWSLEHGFSGTFDLLRSKERNPIDTDYEIVDYKTHKPARTHKPIREGEGVGYLSDIVQLRFYRIALEEMSRQPWCPEWLPRNIRISSQRVVLFTADGSYMEDTREVSKEAALGIVDVARALREVQ